MQVVSLRQYSSNYLSKGRIALIGASLSLSAIIMALAIEAPGHFWLGWVTLLPLMQAARTLAPAGAFGAGMFWGSSLFAASALMGSPSVDVTVSSFAILTLGPALYACFGAWLTGRVGFSPYLMALVWVGVEFCLRPVGLEHGLLAGTQENGWLFSVAGSFAGYFLVAFLVAYINASLLSVLHSVSGSVSSLRLISSAGGPIGLLALLETPFILSRVLCISQPRAPPPR